MRLGSCLVGFSRELDFGPSRACVGKESSIPVSKAAMKAASSSVVRAVGTMAMMSGKDEEEMCCDDGDRRNATVTRDADAIFVDALFGQALLGVASSAELLASASIWTERTILHWQIPPKYSQ